MHAGIKSSDIVRLLNDNGFEVKGPNSNIEDEAIRFLLNYFNNLAKTETKEDNNNVKTESAIEFAFPA